MRKIEQIFRFLIPVIALVALVVFLVGAGRRERATIQKNKALVMRSAEEVWNKGNMAVADEIYASNYIRHQDDLPGGIIRGREALKQFVTNCRTIWPDWHMTLLDMVAEGDKVWDYWAIRGTFTGKVEGFLPPNGKETPFECVIIHRIAGGKDVEDWCFFQDLNLYSQLGMKLVPAEQPGK